MSWASRARAASRSCTPTRPRPGASRTRPARSSRPATCPRGRRSRRSTMIRACSACRRSAASSARRRRRRARSTGSCCREGEPLPFALEGREGDGGARMRRWLLLGLLVLAGCGGRQARDGGRDDAAGLAPDGRDVRGRRPRPPWPRRWSSRCSTARRWRAPGCGRTARWSCSSSPPGAAAARPSRRRWRRWPRSYRDVVTFVGVGGQDKAPAVKSWLDAHDVTYPVGIDGGLADLAPLRGPPAAGGDPRRAGRQARARLAGRRLEGRARRPARAARPALSLRSLLAECE